MPRPGVCSEALGGCECLSGPAAVFGLASAARPESAHHRREIENAEKCRDKNPHCDKQNRDEVALNGVLNIGHVPG